MVVFLEVIAIVLGTYGYLEISATSSFRDALYDSLKLLSLSYVAVSDVKPPLALECARWLSVLAISIAIVKTVLMLLYERLRLSFCRNHVVVCGLGTKGVSLVMEFRAQHHAAKVVVIESESNNSDIQSCREAGAIVLVGNCTDDMLLRKARVARARLLLAVSGEDDVNIKVAIKTEAILRGTRRSPRASLMCYIHVVDRTAQELFKQHSLFKKNDDPIDIRIFNVYERSARAVLDEYEFLPPCLDHPRGDRQPHVVVVGSGWTSRYLVLQLAQTVHGATWEKLLISVVDDNAKQAGDYMRRQHPQLTDIVSCVYANQPVEEISEKGKLVGLASEIVDCIYIALDNETQAICVAKRLRAEYPDIPVVVLLLERTGIAYLIRTMEPVFSEMNIQVFPMIEKAWRREMVLEERLELLAQSIHEDIRVHERNTRDIVWADLPIERRLERRFYADQMQRICNREGRRSQLVSPDSPHQVSVIALLEFRGWMAYKMLEGWRYGPTLDEKLKTDPNLVPWQALSQEFRDKLIVRASRISSKLLLSREGLLDYSQQGQSVASAQWHL